jgi:predicted  nucleic acid-binding Zn-ribbon protein
VTYIDPVLILGVSAVIFAVLNIFLWILVWKKSGADIKKSGIDEIKENLSQSMEREIRLEDQLWGVLDRLRDMERDLTAIKKNISNTEDFRNLSEKIERFNDVLEVMVRNITELNFKLSNEKIRTPDNSDS